LRIAMHVLAQRPSHPLAKQLLWTPGALFDHELHHEYWELAKAAFPHLDADDQEALLQRIHAGPGNDVILQIAKVSEQEPSLQHIRRTLAWSRLRPLTILEPHLNADWKRRLAEELQETGGARPEHPEFLSYISSGSVGWSSSISLQEATTSED